MTISSWRVGSWTTPTTTVTQPPVPSEVSPESRSKISTHIAGQFPTFIREQFPTFIDFVKEYYKSQELKGYCIDIIQNWSDYYNIDNYGDLVSTTTLISAVTTSSTTIDVQSTRDFPNEGLLLIDDEIIYYQKKGSTLFQDCGRGFNAVKAVGIEGEYKFESTTAATHALGAEVVNLNNIFPLYMLGKFKEQFLATYPKNFADGVTESTIIKRIKDFYSSKGTGRSFQFVIRTLFGVESEVSYPRERIFKPSDAFYTSREIIRAVPVSGNPIELVGQVLYQDADPNDPNVDSARIYVKGVVEVFTPSGTIYEIDVDTNNSLGTFVTPYKTVLAQDLGANLTDTTVTVDSTLGWPELNGKFRVKDEIITYTDKTVTQFLGCSRARDNTTNVAHDAGQEVFAAFKIYGFSNVDNSEIQLKVFGGTRGVNLTSGGKYYLPDSKVTTPAAPGFDSLDPIWDSFIYNVRRALRGSSATLGQVETDGSVRCTVVTKEKHRLVRDDIIRILNAPEDLYNNNHVVVGVVDEFTFEFIFSSSPAFGISGFEFYIAREFAFGKSDDTSINIAVSDVTGDVQNTYKSTDHAIVASTGIPTHKIGPFAATDLDPGNQRYLKRIPLTPSIKSEKTATPIGQIGIGANGVPLFSYKSETKKKFGGIKSIERISGGTGYDITNPPTVEFEPDYQLNTTYAGLTRVKYNGNRYQAVNAGKSSATEYPVHTVGQVLVGEIEWLYEGSTASADVTITGSVTSINVTSGGSGYTSEPIVSIVGGGAISGQQAFATAQITDGSVTSINIVSGGSGYTSVPTVSISGGGGSGATGSAICRGPIDAINITNAGTQYTYEPTINLISGSGAVAYPSIINGKIESIIVTFGGSGYFGPPDVVITGDGVGATAFATVDLSTNIVTGITVSSKGVGYTAGSTRVDIVYPGSGAQFQTRLTELSVNEAATGFELGSNTFVSPKTTDPYGGACFQGENFIIYSGEYGYLYNPKQIRFLLKDSIGLDNNNVLQELPPTVHSPIIGWAYDGHPVYGPYGYEDPENKAPFNSYKRIRSSYRVITARASILSGLTDPLGTYIEDYEYVEGLGDLDRYNGRFCVTPEYPNGVYAYFTTITGTDGHPAFPYFIGPEFYGEADKVNWDGNGLQKNFTEDAIRYRAPYIGVDNIVAKRKQLDEKIDFFLTLEDSTTLIVMETGETLTYIEDGIGYYSYYPFIRGGSADSLVVSATNKYSSAGVDQYLVEGGGKEYKVNDRLEFDNTGTGGEGVSATVAQVEGVAVSSLSNVYTATSALGNDLYYGNITCDTSHFLQVGDSVTVSATDNSYTRTLKSKVINGNYHFNYFDLSAMSITDAWVTGTAYSTGDLVYVANRVYEAQHPAGTSGAGTGPTHTSGIASDGGVSWKYLRIRTDGNFFQDGWTQNSAGSGYSNGTYENVPLKNISSDGIGAKATVVVSSGSVSSVTITSFGYGYDIGDTLEIEDVNIGNNGGSGFQITLTKVQREVQCKTNLAHQLHTGDIVNISGVDPVGYNKANYVVVRVDTLNRFTVKRDFATIAAANVTTGNSGGAAEVNINEPNLDLINGHSYVFDTSHASNVNKVLSFTLDPSNTDVLTYKNVIDEVRDAITNEQDSITLKMVDLPGIFYYHNIKHEIVSPRTYTVIVQAKTTSHPYNGYGSGNGYYISGDKYGSVTEAPILTMSRGLTYTFNQTAASNNNHAIYFSESEDAKGGINRYETGVVYKINDVAVSWSDYNSQFSLASTLSRSVEITPSANSPDTLYYVCQNHLAMGNAISVKSDISNSRFFNVINDPILGTHTVTTKTDTAFTYLLALAPESGYSTGVSYSTNSIYPSGGIATITIGDQGRNYQSLPKLSGSSRSGSGATAVATISGGLSNVSVTNQGSGYNQGIPPTCVVTLPDFVDITLENVLGNFIPDEIVISKEKLDNSTARGKVLSWNPITSVLRVQPLQNTRTGAGQKGYLMFDAGTSFSIQPSLINAVGKDDQFNFAAHNAKTGDPVLYVSAETDAVNPLTVGQTYYIIDIGDTDYVKLASTPQLAEAGTAITITGAAGTNSGTGAQAFLLRSRIYTGGSTVAVISSLSGTQATVTPVISGLGKVTQVNTNTAGTNYRAAPNVIFDDPYYGTISTVLPRLSSIASIGTVTSSGNNYGASQTYSGVASTSSQGGSGATFNVVSNSSGGIQSVTIASGGGLYEDGDAITIAGNLVGGSTPAHDLSFSVTAVTGTTGAYTASQTFTGVTQKSISGTSATGAEFTIVINASGNVESVTVTNGGTSYNIADDITISGADLGGTDGTHDVVLDLATMTFSDVVSTATLLDASIDSVTVTNGGSGYLSAPTITAQGGNGINAELNAIIVNQGVENIIVGAAGQQFQSAPIINIEQKSGSGASVLLKSSDLGQILKISGDNITYNYSHDRTLKPQLNTTYNLQLIRTQIIDYFDVINGGANFVSEPEIILEGGQGSLFELEPLILNEVIQSVIVNNPGRGFTSAPTVKARVAHSFVALNSNSTLNFPYNAKIPTGTKVNLVQVSGILPPPFVEGTTYYAVAATTANGLANNQIKLATSLANANTETTIAMTGPPLGDPLTGQSVFQLQTTDLGDSIIAYMKPATFSIGERIYQGASTTSYTAYGVIKNWDASGRVVSVELIEGDFVVGQPVFGEESAAFGQIHAFDRADANFVVSPISTSAATWEKTTGFLDLNEQRVYDSDRFQEFSYDISSSVNITDWKNPLKFAAHPAGFKVVGTQVLTQSVKKEYKPRSVTNQSPSNDYDWWIQQTNSVGTTFNGTTFITPKPSSKRTAKLATINNFALSKPDYTALVPTEVSIYGKQLLDVQKILSCISYKMDDISDRTLSFDGSSSSVVDGTTDRITITNHGFVANQKVTYTSGGDRFLDARDLIVNNIDYIIEESIGYLKATYPGLNLDPTLESKCARDTRLVVAAWTNDLKYGGNYFSRDAAEQYTNGTNVQHVQGEESETVATFNKARDLCLLAVTNDLPVGTYTNIVPQTDLSITNDSGGCTDVKSAITTLAGIVTNAISNPSQALPTQDIGNYPNNRYNTPIGGLTHNAQYYIRYVDANTIELSTTAGGSAIDLTSQGGGVGHSLRCFADGTNNSFRLQIDGVDLNTKLGKTAQTSQLLLSVNGLIANPATYTLSNSIVTFVTPPLSNTRIIAMYFDRSSYSGSFVLDQIGDEIKSFGTGLSGTGVHTFVSGVTNAIQITGGGQRTALSGTSYNPLTGLLIINIGSHSFTTSDTITIANGGVTFTCDADNHASEHAYPRVGDPASGKILAIQTVTGTTITVDVGISNDEPDELVPGTGYTDGVYSAVPLKNRLGTGVGATADITVTNGGVTNVKVVNPGSGYTDTDVLGLTLSAIGEQLVKPFLPTNGTYNPSTGDMVLTIGSGHGLTAPTTHTPTAATYDPVTGFMVVTINNHGLKNRDQVKFADGAITFNCAYGSGGNESYPRSTDYISGKWVKVYECTTNTFTVQVLNAWPSTNTDAHTYVTSAPNSVSFAKSTVRIANESLQFSCNYGSGGTASYPRKTDPIGSLGRQRDIPVEAVSTDTITVNALNGTTPTNTDAHTWEGLSTYQFTPEDAQYTHWDGQLVLKLTGHPLYKGDRIKLANDSIRMTCIQDDFATQHSYPRPGDPAADAWLTVDQVSTDYISVFVGETEGRYKNFTPVVGDTFYKPWYYDQNGNVDFSTPAGTLILDIGSHNLQAGDWIKIKANSLVFTCDYDGDNFQTEKTYPRPIGDSRAREIPYIGDGISSGYGGTYRQQNPLDFQGYDDGDGSYSKYGTSETWLVIIGATANTISVYVGDAGSAKTNTHVFVRAEPDCITASAHRFVSADNNCVERAVVAFGNRKSNRYSDAAGLLRVNATRIAINAYTMMVFDQARQGISFDFESYMTKCVRDTKLLIDAVADNVEFGGNDAVYDAAQLYVDTIHLQGEESQSVQVFNNAMEMCIVVMRNTSSYNNTGLNWVSARWFANDYTAVYANKWHYLYSKPVARGAKYNGTLPPLPGETSPTIVYRNAEGGGWVNNSEYYGASTNGQVKDHTISIDEDVNQFYPQGKITAVTLNVPAADQGNYQYTPGSWSVSDLRAFVRAADGSIREAKGATGSIQYSGTAPNITLTGATVSNGGTGFRVGDVIELRDVSSQAWKGTSSTSVGGGAAGPISQMTEQDHMITLTVTAVSGVDASDNAFNGGGDFPLHETSDFLENDRSNLFNINGDYDANKRTWSYSDNSCQDVESTIRVLWGIVTQAVGTGAHTFVQSTSGNITVTGGGSGPFTAVAPTTYDNTTGLMVMEIGSHSLTTSDTVTIAANSMTFTCNNDGNRSPKTYPRTSDPAYNTAVAITAVTATTITVNVGTNNGNLTGITRTASTSPEFQVGVADVAFDGNDKTFTTQSGGSTQILPASDNFLIFLNSTLQIKGSTQAYTYTGSEITFTEAPLPGMDFYGFYFGKLTQLDEIAPFFDNKKKTFTMTQNTEPFSLESDNAAVQAQNNLLIFLNGVYQEPGIAYSLTGSIIEFSEAPRAGSDCILFIYTGSTSDILVSNTFNSIDPEDRVQIASEGSDRRVATVSSSTTIDSYEYTGLRPTVAEFTATVAGGQVTQVAITNQGSNYEVPPILLFIGGGGEGAAAETQIEVGSGRVLSVINLQGGSGYTSAPTVLAVHPLALERKQRNRIVSNSLSLGGSYLTQNISSTDTTINLKNVYFNSAQKAGFPDEGEVLIPFYDTSVTPNRWNNERILYGAKDVNANTLTVATGGRGHEGTTAAAHIVITGTYSVSQDSTSVTINLGTDHNFVTGENRVYLDFTSGTNVVQIDSNPADPSNNYITYLPPDGLYDVTVVSAQVFTIQIPNELRKLNPYPDETTITPHTEIYLDTSYPVTITGNVSLLPEVRLRSL